MKKKIVGILVCMLVIAATVLPVAGTLNIDINTNVEKSIIGLNRTKQDENLFLTSNSSILGTKQEQQYDNITGSGTTNYIPKFTDTTTIGNSVIYETDGKIGVGTTSPLYPLEVKGRIASIPGDNSGLSIGGDTDGGGTINTKTSSGFFVNIRIKWAQTCFNGKVGIGEAITPSALLHVIAGAAGDTAIRGRSSGWAGYFEGKSYFSDNVGIGTTTPNYKLDVFDGNDIVAQFSGRVKGAEAVNNDEFVTKKQVKALVRDQLQGLMQLLYSPLARNFINQNIDDQSISNQFMSIMKTRYTPTGTNDNNGNIGDITYDDSYIYIKTNEGWKRTALEKW